MDTTFKREESIFYEVVEMTDVVQRRRFLDEACAGKPAMRANLDALLAAHERATQFFEESNVSLKSSLASAGVEPAAGKNSALKLPSDEQPGTRIGHYRLLQKIGEGGGGAVYLAEQFEPVRRQVAFKIIKLGMDTKNVIARFELERQALAMMDHPNIAQVFDAGATETGRPYFVMELVRGVKITEYCDRNQLNVRQRLELFAQVCHAIQHAHQKGVIHRDIKPSNILVTLLDGAPVPKVIDFGVAKATAVDLTEKTFSTAHGHLIGTPAYMSPEQAQMSGLDIDTRSDIYSLGVLLYELLTSQTPFDANELVQSGLDEMRRTLRDEEPYRPSAKLNTLHGTELTQTAACRHIEPPRLKSLLKGDLDWVVMKCLEKDRRRRYETANGLAMDIRRFLDNEPVMARPPSRVYRLQKLVLRNKVVFASGVAVTAALIFGLGAATWAFLREKDARQRAEIREKITQAAFAVSRDRPEDADRIIVGISNVPPSLESAVAYRSLGEWHALNNRWRQAADKYTELLLVNRYDGWNTRTLDALRCGTVLAELNDPEQYDTFREQAVARFADAAYSVAAERILKATLLRSATPEFCRKLEPFAETAMLKTPLPSVPVTAPEQAVFPHRASFALISACSFDGHSVGVCFSQPLDLTSATNPASYQISGTIVTNVVLAADKKSVVLQLASVIAGNFVVAVNNVQDTAQNEIAAGGTASGTVLNLDFLALGDAAGASNAVSFSGNVAKINAGGSDLWYEGDHFVFQYLLVTNDFDFCLRVQSVTDTDGTGFARAGLMARDSLTDITGHTVTVERNADRPAVRTGSFQVTLRTVAGVPKLTESQPPFTLPTAGGQNSWVRLKRTGTTFTCFTSTNQADWSPLWEFDGATTGDGAFTNRVLYLGIATCAHSLLTNTAAVVSDFGMTPPQPVKINSQPASSVEWRSGNAANLRVAASGYPVFYQWRKNGVDIPGATNSTLVIPCVRSSDAAVYSALVFNNISGLVTADVTATVHPDTDPPVVGAAVSYDGASVGVSFNKGVDPATATNLANYSVNDAVVKNVTVEADGRSVVLQLDQRISGKFFVTVSNVKDLSQNIVSAGSKTAGTVFNLQLLAVGDAANQPFSTACNGATVTTVAGGSDIGELGDHFDHLVYQYLTVTNDFDFRLHVRSVSGGGGVFARTGLMARDFAGNISCHQIMVAVNAGNTFQVIVRSKAGSVQSQSEPPNPLPAAYADHSWVRLQRIGTTFYTYCSDDGESWTKLYQFDSAADEDGPFANALCLGIATSAWSSSRTVRAVVSDFGVTQTMPASAMLSLGLLEYRRGNYLKAMDWSRRCINYPDYQAARMAAAHAILAMCCRQLHQLDVAHSELAKAANLVEAQAATENDPGNVTQGFWYDWVSARVLLREAEQNLN